MIKTLTATREAWNNYRYWQQHDTAIITRINTLITETKKTPFSGIGKPEVLQGDLTGFWSRRIDATHRLVYAVDETRLTIISCRYLYSD